MAMDCFPSSSGNRSVRALRDKFVKGSGIKMFSDEAYAQRLLALADHSIVQVPTNSSDSDSQ
jgi:hypothetical protein